MENSKSVVHRAQKSQTSGNILHTWLTYPTYFSSFTTWLKSIREKVTARKNKRFNKNLKLKVEKTVDFVELWHRIQLRTTDFQNKVLWISTSFENTSETRLHFWNQFNIGYLHLRFHIVPCEDLFPFRFFRKFSCSKNTLNNLIFCNHIKAKIDASLCLKIFNSSKNFFTKCQDYFVQADKVKPMTCVSFKSFQEFFKSSALFQNLQLTTSYMVKTHMA